LKYTTTAVQLGTLLNSEIRFKGIFYLNMNILSLCGGLHSIPLHVMKAYINQELSNSTRAP